MHTATRYHPVVAVFHWLLAVLLLAEIGLGFVNLATASTDRHKLDGLEIHMAGGVLIFALMVLRFIARLLTPKPGKLPSGVAIMDRLKKPSYIGAYLLVVLMVISGFATAFAAGLPAIVFARSGAPLPPSLLAYPSQVVHFALAMVFILLIAVHVATMIYHHRVLKDAMMRRMSLGARE